MCSVLRFYFTKPKFEVDGGKETKQWTYSWRRGRSPKVKRLGKPVSRLTSGHVYMRWVFHEVSGTMKALSELFLRVKVRWILDLSFVN